MRKSPLNILIPKMDLELFKNPKSMIDTHYLKFYEEIEKERSILKSQVLKVPQ